MNAFKIFLQVSSDGQPATIYHAKDVKIQGDMIRITFIGDEGVSYSVTVISNSKVTLACKGVLTYAFSLEEGKTSRFLIDALSGEIPCEVFCSKLNIIKNANIISISGKYKLDVSGNKSLTVFNVKGEL